jgi:hypothetical protein
MPMESLAKYFVGGISHRIAYKKRNERREESRLRFRRSFCRSPA